MTVSSTTKRNSYTGNGSTTTFAYSFKIFDDDDITVILRTTATGTETVQTKTTHYSVTGVGSASGGNVVFGSAPTSAQTVVLLRQTAQTQATDYTPNDPFPAASHEDALDKLTLMAQDQQDELDRTIKLSRTNTMTSTEFTVGATDRANKVLGFDGNGELTVTQELGTFRGDFAASTSYSARDIIRDTSTGNIFIVNEAHTSSGSEPLTSNANSAKYTLLIESATAGVVAGTVTASRGVIVDSNKDITGFRNVTLSGELTLGSGAVINEAELEAIDGVTAGTVAASKAVVVDSNKDAASFRNITLTGELDAGSLDVSGDADIDGTLEADAITVNGTALNTVIAGVTVTDATNSAHVLVTDNESTNEENLITFVEDATSSTGNVGLEMDGNLTYNPSTGTVTATVFKGNIDAVDGDFDGTLEADAMTLNGTAITATATLDTGISNNNVPKFTSGVADNDFLRVDGTAIEGRSASEVLSDIAAAPAAGSSNIVTTGALNSGSITSGFGSIDNGSSNITTTGVGSFGSLDISGDIDVDGTTNLDVVDIDGAVDMASTLQVDGAITSSAGATITTADNTAQLTLKSTDADANVGPLLVMMRDSSSPADNDILARIDFKGDNDAGEETFFGSINAVATDVSDGAEDGQIKHRVMVNGTVTSVLDLDASGAAVTGGITATAASTITTSDNSNNLTLTSTDADANTGPNLVMTRASGSPADNDAIGELTFNFNNDAAENTVGTRWRNFIIDASDSTEDAAFDIFSMKQGSLKSIINYDASTLILNDSGANIDFRIESTGNTHAIFVDAGNDHVLFGKSASNSDNAGFEVLSNGSIAATRSSGHAGLFNRLSDNGAILNLRKDGTTVGTIGSVLVNTTLNGFIVLEPGSGGAGIAGYGGSSNGALVPCNESGAIADNAKDWGASSARWDDIFASNGTIQTSDQNEKQNIASLTSAEITAAKSISKLFKTFKWKDKVTAKGDAARTHTGVIAQEVQAAMSAAGLDATNYAFWCSDTWWEKSTEVAAVKAVEAADAVYDDDGVETSPAVEAVEAKDAYTRVDTYYTEEEAPEGATKRTRLGVRYPELLAFIGAATEQRLTDIESRLTALEAG